LLFQSGRGVMCKLLYLAKSAASMDYLALAKNREGKSRLGRTAMHPETVRESDKKRLEKVQRTMTSVVNYRSAQRLRLGLRSPNTRTSFVRQRRQPSRRYCAPTACRLQDRVCTCGFSVEFLPWSLPQPRPLLCRPA